MWIIWCLFRTRILEFIRDRPTPKSSPTRFQRGPNLIWRDCRHGLHRSKYLSDRCMLTIGKPIRRSRGVSSLHHGRQVLESLPRCMAKRETNGRSISVNEEWLVQNIRRRSSGSCRANKQIYRERFFLLILDDSDFGSLAKIRAAIIFQASARLRWCLFTAASCASAA